MFQVLSSFRAELTPRLYYEEQLEKLGDMEAVKEFQELNKLFEEKKAEAQKRELAKQLRE